MVKTTETAIRAVAAADRTITPEQLRDALDVLKGRVACAVTNPEPLDRVLRRETVAELMAKGKRRRDGKYDPKAGMKAVDVLCRRGLLKRIYAPGGRRAIGISENSYRAFVAGAGAGAGAEAGTEAVAVEGGAV